MIRTETGFINFFFLLSFNQDFEFIYLFIYLFTCISFNFLKESELGYLYMPVYFNEKRILLKYSELSGQISKFLDFWWNYPEHNGKLSFLTNPFAGQVRLLLTWPFFLTFFTSLESRPSQIRGNKV